MYVFMKYVLISSVREYACTFFICMYVCMYKDFKYIYVSMSIFVCLYGMYVCMYAVVGLLCAVQGCAAEPRIFLSAVRPNPVAIRHPQRAAAVLLRRRLAAEQLFIEVVFLYANYV